MLGLVLARNIIQLYVFWELVGLSSYLLIGFWYHRPAAAAAPRQSVFNVIAFPLGCGFDTVMRRERLVGSLCRLHGSHPNVLTVAMKLMILRFVSERFVTSLARITRGEYAFPGIGCASAMTSPNPRESTLDAATADRSADP